MFPKDKDTDIRKEQVEAGMAMAAAEGDQVNTIKTPGGPSDTPFDAAELTKRRMAFVSHPVTPAAHVWLKDQDLAFNQRLRSMVIRQAENKGRQITLAEVEETWKNLLGILESEKAEKSALYDTKSDPEAVKALGSKVKCGFTVLRDGNKVACGSEFEPSIWNLVRNGEVLKHRGGPLKGQPIRCGNFSPRVNGVGEKVVVGLCPGHTKEVRTNGIEVYPYKRATEMLASQENKEMTLSEFFEARYRGRGYGDRRR